MTPNHWSHYIFLHIPKTAGTTLNHVIDRQFPPSAIFSLGPVTQKSLAEFKALPDERRASIQLLKGHLAYGIHTFFPGHTSYFTLLREPIDRVISFYYFVTRNQNHYLNNFVISKNLSLHDFLESRVSIMMSNFQVRLISGVWDTYPFGECPRETLETAKKILRDKITVVGLTEKFDQTLLLLQRAYGWRNIFYTKHNVTPNRPARKELDGRTLASIEKFNQLDIELYTYAQALFDERWLQAGPDMARCLRRYRIFNRSLYPLQQLYWQGRKWSMRAWIRQKLGQ